MTAVVCASGVELLMDYLEGVLPPDVNAALERHVAGCERCAAFVASYRETPRILRDATAAALPLTSRRPSRHFCAPGRRRSRQTRLAPISIDYLNVGKGPRTISWGIVEWAVENLRVCMAKANDPRPADFSSEAGSGRTLSVWKRK
jgi:anti-sigma factor RsiW